MENWTKDGKNEILVKTIKCKEYKAIVFGAKGFPSIELYVNGKLDRHNYDMPVTWEDAKEFAEKYIYLSSAEEKDAKKADIKNLKKQIETTKKQIENIKEKIENFELDPDKYEDAYCNMLDECYDKFMDSYDASRVLKEIDPIAYHCGLSDYVDGLELEDDEEYKELLEEKEELENKLEELESFNKK